MKVNFPSLSANFKYQRKFSALFKNYCFYFTFYLFVVYWSRLKNISFIQKPSGKLTIISATYYKTSSLWVMFVGQINDKQTNLMI